MWGQLVARCVGTTCCALGGGGRGQLVVRWEGGGQLVARQEGVGRRQHVGRDEAGIFYGALG